ncbi:MAG: Do family serine endopeptidase [Alphaproteobacteria bacterium]|nr:Do family serine endopeptidase [Alphaproteobacteria bacterium]
MTRLFSNLLFVVSIMMAAPVLAADDAPRIPTSKQDIAISFSPVIKRVAPAVVNIYTRTLVRQRMMISPFMNDPLFRQFFGDQMPQGLTQKRVQNSLGSGVMVGENGIVVTNNHVIEGADQITVVLSDRREFEASIITDDKRSDLAVLKLKTKGETFPTLTLADSDDAEVGDVVLAIGNPFGVGQTVTMGIISAVARAAEVSSSDYNYFIQTDAAINPGNSGGALITADGKLVGIPSAIYSKDGGSLGIGFAIPSNLVRTVIASASQGGTVVRGWLGISVQALNSEIAQSVGLNHPTGVIVRKIHKQSPALDAGLKIGDVILAINGKEITDEEGLRYRTATAAVDTSLTFSIMRKQEKQDITVKISPPPKETIKSETTLTGDTPLSGARVVNPSPALTQDLGLPDDIEGVIVLGTSKGSVAARLGLQRGDLIIGINNNEIKSVSDIQTALNAPASAWKISINRGGNVITVVVR